MWLGLCLLALTPAVAFSEWNVKEGECLNNTYPPRDERQVPKYVINLDLPPAERWTQLGKEKKQELSKVVQVLKNLTYAFFGDTVIRLVDKAMPVLLKTLPEPYKSEIQGLADVTGIPVGELTLYNVFYELFTVCTSIVTRDEEKNLTLHARNLDFGLFLSWDPKNHTWAMTEALRPTVVQLDFQKSNVSVFQAANFVGYVGILSGLKNGLFSLTIDERFKTNGGYWGFLEWIMGKRDQSWLGFTMRDVLEKAEGYLEAQKMLVTTELLAPAYFIIGGNRSDEACIITKNRKSNTADVWTMEDADSWFLLETNYDHWNKPPFFDDRRTPAVNCMTKKSEAVGSTFPGLFDVLSSKPNLNLLTVYTCLMNAKESTMETYLQRCEGTCSPW